MATRMQQRRGTAAQWISTNNGDGPVLEVGEIGFESDTGKFKIGDGTNHWVDLDYFLDESDIDGITGDYVLANTLGQANGVATLDSSGKLTGSQIPGIDELAQDAVDLALVAGTGITKTYNDNANTITLSVDTSTIQSRVANITDTEIGYLDGVTSNVQAQIDNKLDSSTASSTYAPLASPTFTGTVTLPSATVTSAMLADETIVNADIANNAAIAQSKIDGLTTDLAAKAALAGATFTGNVVVQQDLQIDGSFTVNGSNVLVSATQIQIEDSILQLAHENAANTVDLGIVAGYNDGTAKHAGLVKDATDGKWKFFKGVTTEPGTTVDFTQATLDDLVVGGLEASSLTVGDVSNTEFGYLANVTSDIQSQIDGKISASSTDTLLNKTVNLANNTVSGTIAQFNTALSDADFATLAGTETLTNKLLDEPVFASPEERWTVSTTAATGTINFDAKTSGILYYTTNASGNWTLNVRGDGSNTLNNMLATNDSITVVFFATNGATPFYQTGFQIDGSAVTPKWQNATAPTAGNANSIDIYSYTIVKTANATFTAFGSQTRFA